jgi:hypothetical protein
MKGYIEAAAKKASNEKKNGKAAEHHPQIQPQGIQQVHLSFCILFYC